MSCARDDVGRAHGSLDFVLWTYRERQQKMQSTANPTLRRVQYKILVFYVSFKGYIVQTNNSIYSVRFNLFLFRDMTGFVLLNVDIRMCRQDLI
jgi:hypothetical protein